MWHHVIPSLRWRPWPDNILKWNTFHRTPLILILLFVINTKISQFHILIFPFGTYKGDKVPESVNRAANYGGLPLCQGLVTLLNHFQYKVLRMVYRHIQYLMLVVNQQMVIRCSQEEKNSKMKLYMDKWRRKRGGNKKERAVSPDTDQLFLTLIWCSLTRQGMISSLEPRRF